MGDLVVGQKVILKRNMMNEHEGSVGFVYETYPDFDDSGKMGASIIFQRGSYDGFSAQEQSLFLEAGRVDQRYAMYEFKNVNQVLLDYRSGYWDFIR